MRWTVLLAFVAAASASSGRRSKKRQSSSDDPGATPSDAIYVSYPACGSFRCSVSWPQGLNTYVNWLNPPVGGDVSVTLNSNTNGTNYVVADRVPSISQAGYCDAGAGVGTVIPGKTCGRVEFIVPSFWQPGNYSIAVTSLQNSSIAGFTDFVVVSPPNSTELSSAAASASSANAGATNVVLETISAPTSTDSDDKTSYTGPSTPAPTAGSDASSSSAPASSSSRDSSSSSSSSAAGSSSSSAVQPSSSSRTEAPTSTSASPSSSASTSPADTLVPASSLLLATFAPLLALIF